MWMAVRHYVIDALTPEQLRTLACDRRRVQARLETGLRRDRRGDLRGPDRPWHDPVWSGQSPPAADSPFPSRTNHQFTEGTHGRGRVRHLPRMTSTRPSRAATTGGLEGVTEQLDESDTLLTGGLDDPLDEGYSPPDREPSIDVPTEAEEERGRVPRPTVGLRGARRRCGRTTSRTCSTRYGDEVGGAGSGRFVDDETDGVSDDEKDLFAERRRYRRRGASAEEAAVHIIDVDDVLSADRRFDPAVLSAWRAGPRRSSRRRMRRCRERQR